MTCFWRRAAAGSSSCLRDLAGDPLRARQPRAPVADEDDPGGLGQRRRRAGAVDERRRPAEPPLDHRGDRAQPARVREQLRVRDLHPPPQPPAVAGHPQLDAGQPAVGHDRERTAAAVVVHRALLDVHRPARVRLERDLDEPDDRIAGARTRSRSSAAAPARPAAPAAGRPRAPTRRRTRPRARRRAPRARPSGSRADRRGGRGCRRGGWRSRCAAASRSPRRCRG